MVLIKNIKYILLSVFIFCVSSVHTQTIIQKIPFEYKAGWIVINLKINNNIEGKFIFDTGVLSLILDKNLVEKHNIKTEDSTIKINGIGKGGGESAGYVKQVKLGIGNLNKLH
jgi:hypothetical protein